MLGKEIRARNGHLRNTHMEVKTIMKVQEKMGREREAKDRTMENTYL